VLVWVLDTYLLMTGFEVELANFELGELCTGDGVDGFDECATGEGGEEKVFLAVVIPNQQT